MYESRNFRTSLHNHYCRRRAALLLHFALVRYLVLSGMPSWAFYVVRIDKIYLGHHIICPIFSFNFNQIWMSSVCFHKRPITKFRGNLSSWSHACTRDRGTGRLKVMTKVMGAFCDNVHAPKNK